MRYLLDTNVCVDFLTARYPRVIEHWLACRPQDLGLSPIVAAELRFGAEKSQRAEGNHRKLDSLFAELTEVPFSAKAGFVYGRLRLALERQGQLIGSNDLLIASQAVELDLTLVTNNVKEFRRVDGLRFEDWRQSA